MDSFDPENNNDYAPNPVQLEFIRLVAEKYWYLAFGDSWHASTEIRAFMTCEQTLDALCQAGKSYYFTEDNPKAQDYLDFLAGRQEYNQAAKKGASLFGGMWLKEKNKDMLRGVFKRALGNNPSIRVVAADKRQEHAIKMLSKVFGAMVKLLFSSSPDETMRQGLGWDNETAAFIKSFNKSSTISFGLAHFDKRYTAPDNYSSLGILLPEKDKDLCVLAVYQDSNQYARTKVLVKPPASDAKLFIFPEKEANNRTTLNNPMNEALYELFASNAQDEMKNGIIINNPALQPLYEQAVENVKKAASLHRRPQNNGTKQTEQSIQSGGIVKLTG